MGSGDDARIAAKAVRGGAVDFMSEPIGEDELKTMLHEHLNETPSRAEAALAPQPTVSASTQVSLPAAISATDPPEVVELSEGVSFVCASPAMKEIHDQIALGN